MPLRTWKKLSESVVFKNPWWTYKRDAFELPSGKAGEYHYVHTNGSSMVLPIMEDGTILLVNQYRYLLNRESLEFPCGSVKEGFTHDETARHELVEETGYSAGSLEHLSSIYTTPGFCDEELHIFLGTGLHQSPHGHRREEGELSMTIQPMLLQEAITMIETGEIKDAKTIIGLLLIERRMRGKH